MAWRYTVSVPQWIQGKDGSSDSVVLFRVNVLLQPPGASTVAADSPFFVMRRYNQFRLLYEQLRTSHPGIMKERRMAPPPKHAMHVGGEKAMLERRKVLLERWLWRLVGNPVISRSQELKAFLEFERALNRAINIQHNHLDDEEDVDFGETYNFPYPAAAAFPYPASSIAQSEVGDWDDSLSEISSYSNTSAEIPAWAPASDELSDHVAARDHAGISASAPASDELSDRVAARNGEAGTSMQLEVQPLQVTPAAATATAAATSGRLLHSDLGLHGSAPSNGREAKLMLEVKQAEAVEQELVASYSALAPPATPCAPTLIPTTTLEQELAASTLRFSLELEVPGAECATLRSSLASALAQSGATIDSAVDKDLKIDRLECELAESQAALAAASELMTAERERVKGDQITLAREVQKLRLELADSKQRNHDLGVELAEMVRLKQQMRGELDEVRQQPGDQKANSSTNSNTNSNTNRAATAQRAGDVNPLPRPSPNTFGGEFSNVDAPQGPLPGTLDRKQSMGPAQAIAVEKADTPYAPEADDELSAAYQSLMYQYQQLLQHHDALQQSSTQLQLRVHGLELSPASASELTSEQKADHSLVYQYQQLVQHHDALQQSNTQSQLRVHDLELSTASATERTSEQKANAAVVQQLEERVHEMEALAFSSADALRDSEKQRSELQQRLQELELVTSSTSHALGEAESTSTQLQMRWQEMEEAVVTSSKALRETEKGRLRLAEEHDTLRRQCDQLQARLQEVDGDAATNAHGRAGAEAEQQRVAAANEQLKQRCSQLQQKVNQLQAAAALSGDGVGTRQATASPAPKGSQALSLGAQVLGCTPLSIQSQFAGSQALRMGGHLWDGSSSKRKQH
eukprot:gene4926-34697_t